VTARLDGPSAAARIRVMKRDRFQCTYCGTPGTDAELEVDHIVAVANGGSHHISNLTTSCRGCNQKKGTGPAPPNHKPMNTNQHPLVGMCLHTFNARGEIRYQGHIIGIDGDVVLVQLYSFLDGSPTRVEKMSKSDVYSSSCQLYATHDDMNAAYDEDSRKRAREFERRFA
jgi:hypothetical protein